MIAVLEGRGLLIKLLLLVAFPVLTMCGIGYYGYRNTQSTFEDAQNVQRATVEITRPLNQLRQLSLLMVIAPTDELQGEFNQEQVRITQELDATIDRWRAESADEEQAAAFEALERSWTEYKEIKDVTVKKVQDDYREEAFINVIEAERPQFAIVNDKLGDWTAAKITAAREQYDRALLIYITVIVLTIVVVLGVGFIAARSIFRPIEMLKTAATSIAGHAGSGTLEVAFDTQIEVGSEDELGQLADAVRQMVETLRSAMEKLSVEQRRTHAILNSTADGIMTVSEKGEIRSFNAAAVRLLGYEVADVLGENAANLLPGFTTNHQDSRGSRGSTSGAGAQQHSVGNRWQLGEREVYAISKNGDEVPIALRVTETDYLGERLYIATLQDIAERKRAERERLQIAVAIRDAVNRLATTSRHILDSTKNQLSGTQQQASAVTEMLTSMEEVAQTAEQAAERAEKVAESARRSDEVGRAGRTAIENSVTAMNEAKGQVQSIAENILALAERAQAIGEITATVNDIAEQTNVLALNAAVEASRAGEHGKGFAVVASEVKSLAEQAKKATGQVRQILNEIQQATNKSVLATEQGTKAVAEAGDVIREAGETITSLSKTLADSARAASQITASARNQAVGVSQLNESMKNIDDVTHQNVVTIQQIEEAAKNLNALSNELASLTARVEAD